MDTTHTMSDVAHEDGFLRAYLAERDAACPSCRYSLKGLSGDRCPECNQQLLLSVQLVEPKLAAYVAGLVGLAAGAGFSVLLVCFFTYMTWRDGQGIMYPEFLIVTGIGAVIEGGLLAAWIVWGRRIRRSATAWRWLGVAGIWLLTLINCAAFSAVAR